MLAEILLSCDGKKPQAIDFASLFDYNGKKSLKKLKSLRAVADASSMSLSFLADLFPALQILRLNHSQIPSIRDLGMQLSSLRLISLEHCGLTSLNGISAICPRVEEVYVGFNMIDDLSELIGLGSLCVLNIESNQIVSLQSVELLNCCKKLRGLVLRGNMAESTEDYRAEVKRLLPRLRSLDDVKYGEELEKVEEAVVGKEEEVADVLKEEEPRIESPIAPIGPLLPMGEAQKLRPVTTRPGTRRMLTSGKIARPVGGRSKVWYNTGPLRL
jgi:hypothetical protein